MSATSDTGHGTRRHALARRVAAGLAHDDAVRPARPALCLKNKAPLDLIRDYVIVSYPSVSKYNLTQIEDPPPPILYILTARPREKGAASSDAL